MNATQSYENRNGSSLERSLEFAEADSPNPAQNLQSAEKVEIEYVCGSSNEPLVS